MPDANLALHENRLPQLTTHTGLRLREDALYSNAKGEEKAGIRKRLDQTLERLKDVLPRLLQPDEAILYVAKAQVYPTWVEQFLSRWHQSLRPSVQFVFTNRRLLALRTRAKGFMNWKWDRGIRVVRWGDVEGEKVKGFLMRILELKTRNGVKERFWRIGMADVKKIRLLLARLLPASAGDSSATQGFVSLCPTCLTPLTPRVYDCPQCRGTFKDEKTLLRRALLIPGGACFYVGWTGLGVLGALVEAILAIDLIVLCTAAYTSASPGRSGSGASKVEELLTSVVILLVLLSLEKLVAWIHCRWYVRDFIPAE
ncbi:MAG TPA: zf-TFIIB domain-containing protein [Candidatus Acidoferrum sp.]|nr:zf-TFIIB domain-containing protein [Candidatus Acidoferrum sp.]